MRNKVNIKARVNRHLRIFKDWIWKDKKRKKISFKKSNLWYNLVLAAIFFLPFYPRLSSFVYSNNIYDFYRWDIDESSILQSYFWDDESFWNESPLLESSDSFLSVNTILEDERDLVWTNEIIEYEVKNGESFSSIWSKFGVSLNSIYWANWFSKSHVLQPGDFIKIPPVSGLIYTIKKWDSLSKIAKKYEIPESSILEQNLLTKDDPFVIWDIIVIPWAKKIIPKPVYKPAPKSYATTSQSTTGWYNFAKYANSQYVSAWWKYPLVWRKPYSWVAWNCTWYVASYKNVDWRWNANQWLRSAKAKWHNTGSNPTIWSIVVFNGRWYNPKYGHVLNCNGYQMK